MDNRTSQLGDGVWRLEVNPFTNCFLMAANGRDDADGLTLVDCGTSGAGPRLVRSIRLLGFDPTAICDIVLTHWHADHMGAAARFAGSSAAPSVHVGRDDLAAVRGANPYPHRRAAPGDITRLGRLVARMATPGPAVPEAHPLDDGALLDHANGAEVVASPGHTPGHIAVLIARAGVLIAGDAVMNLGRVTLGFGPFRSARTQEAATLRRLAALEFEVLAVGHGPPVVKGARRHLQRLADRAATRSPTAAT